MEFIPNYPNKISLRWRCLTSLYSGFNVFFFTEVLNFDLLSLSGFKYLNKKYANASTYQYIISVLKKSTILFIIIIKFQII